MARPPGGTPGTLLACLGNRVVWCRDLFGFLSLSVLLVCPAWAAKWDIVPTLSFVESYSDNIGLTDDASRQSDWVTTAIPGISINATGAGLRFNLNYAPEIVYYAHTRDDIEVFNKGSAFGVAELAKQFLFIEGGALVNQYDISPLGPLTTSNINITGNRATVANYYASPYVRSSVGSQVQAEARYTYSLSKSNDQPQLVDSVGNAIDLRLASGPAYGASGPAYGASGPTYGASGPTYGASGPAYKASGPAYKAFAWDLSYHRENIEYTGTQVEQDTKIETGWAGARRMITYTTALTAQVGYDYYKRGVLVPASEGWGWNAGLDWTPSPRTRLAAAAGDRFYGNYYSLDFTHRTRLTTWNAGYSQSITTTRSEFFVPATASSAAYLDTLFSSQFPDPVARQKAVENFIARTGLPPSLASPVNFFTTQLFLAKRWQASAGIMGVRNVVIANVFNETREGLAGELVLPNAPNANTQTGTSLVWNWRMTPKTTLNANGAYIRVETPFPFGQIDRYSYAGLSLTRQFQPKLTGTVGYRGQQNNPEFGSGYTENVGYASIQMRF